MYLVADKNGCFLNLEKTMNKTILTPILILGGILGIMAVMALTHLFTPVVAFIHSGSINLSQALVCLLFTVFGFAAAFYYLNSLCRYFVPRIDAGLGKNPIGPDNDLLKKIN
jgi:hypothetical protein